jgi:hypothetical protein
MKEKYSGTFVPYRRPKMKSPQVLKAEQELLRVTESVNELLKDIAINMDCGGKDGKIAFRDEHGVIWIVTIEKSDVSQLQCEFNKE